MIQYHERANWTGQSTKLLVTMFILSRKALSIFTANFELTKRGMASFTDSIIAGDCNDIFNACINNMLCAHVEILL